MNNKLKAKYLELEDLISDEEKSTNTKLWTLFRNMRRCLAGLTATSSETNKSEGDSDE